MMHLESEANRMKELLNDMRSENKAVNAIISKCNSIKQVIEERENLEKGEIENLVLVNESLRLKMEAKRDDEYQEKLEAMQVEDHTLHQEYLNNSHKNKEKIKELFKLFDEKESNAVEMRQMIKEAEEKTQELKALLKLYINGTRIRWTPEQECGCKV
eukprot:TRINITY_DN6097_c0_g1_i4.p1 TRINITY_DN6097_c0_g1~~TRINITY_DN6097_c0_g1_i4.p1  ORF type:complete len:158 (+),score=49.42 TRINITY_DN6097_c0_g1_i4:177-650(+)